MAEGTPRAFSLRVFPLLLILAVTMTTTMAAPQATAQTTEGSVRILPAISSVDAKRGPFTVFIVLQDLEHYGALQYDDDRDTVPDRTVESVGLAAFQFTIQYDPAVLAVAGVEPGPDLGRTGRTFQCLPPAEEPGSFSFGCLSMGPEPPGLQGTLTLASVSFQPLKPGASPLLLEAELAGPLGADQVPVDLIGGVARVMGSGGLAPGPTSQSGETSSADVRLAQTPPSSAATAVPTGSSGTPEGEGRAGTVSPARSPPHRGDRDGLTFRSGDPEAQTSGSPTGSRSQGETAVWWLIALGALAGAGLLGLAAVLWRRGDRGGGR